MMKAGTSYIVIKLFITRKSSTTINKIIHLPPLAIRIGIISSSVGLATPLFATAGVFRLWYNYLPKTQTGQGLKLILGLLGGGGALSLTSNYVLPFLRDHSVFVLPFALSNAIAAGFYYTIGDIVFGLPFMAGGAIGMETLGFALPKAIVTLATLGLPIGGVMIGALTALTAPFLWPAAFSLCWDDKLKTLFLDNEYLWLVDAYLLIALPVGLPIGVLSGATMHLLLKSSIIGTPGVHWNKQSLPVLIALLGVSTCYFYTFSSPSSDYFWVTRMNFVTGDLVSYNPITKITVKDLSKASKAEMQQSFCTFLHTIRRGLKTISFSNRAEATKQTGTSYNTSNMSDRIAFYSIMDILVRLKYLNKEMISRNREKLDVSSLLNDIKELKLKASSTIGISDLEGYLKLVEVAVIVKRRGNDSTIGDKTKSLLLLNEMKSKIKQYNGNDSNMKNNLSFLNERLSEFEEELLLKLQHRIADSLEKEDQLLGQYHKEKMFTGVAITVRNIITIVAALLALKYVITN
jgi:hypothetical protein